MTGASSLPFLLPEALPALALAPLLWLASLAVEARRRRRLAELLGPRAAVLARDLDNRRRRWRRGLASGGLLLAILAAAQPAWGVDEQRLQRQGLDLVLCLDVSRSMLARDLPPSRLQRAKNEIAALARHLRGGRLALVAFAGDARLLVPLTSDVDSFVELLQAADPLSVTRGGTDLGAALEAGLAALGERDTGGAAIALLTDGEDHGQRGRRAAARCRQRQVPVFCIGVASPRGGKIPIRTGSGERFLRDASGREVVSVLDAAALRAIAEAGGGTYVEAASSNRCLIELYEDEIRPRAGRSAAAATRRAVENRFQWPLLLALLLLCLESGLTDRRPPPRRQR